MNNKFSSKQILVFVKFYMTREWIVKSLDVGPIDQFFLMSQTNTYLTDKTKWTYTN